MFRYTHKSYPKYGLQSTTATILDKDDDNYFEKISRLVSLKNNDKIVRRETLVFLKVDILLLLASIRV